LLKELPELRTTDFAEEQATEGKSMAKQQCSISLITIEHL